MKDRIKSIRKEKGMTQQAFADALGVAKNNIANYEIGRRSPSTGVIQLICNIFNVNETWLLTGEGEMHAPASKEQEIASIAAMMFKEDESSFRYQMVKLIAQMDEDQMKMLKDMAVKIVEVTKDQAEE